MSRTQRPDDLFAFERQADRRLRELENSQRTQVEDLNARIAALELPLITTQVALAALTPTNGMEVYFQTSAMDSAWVAPWRLRYRSTSPHTHKWDVVGQPTMRSYVATDQSVASDGVWRDAATVGPQIVAPLAGLYVARGDCDAYPNGVASTA